MVALSQILLNDRARRSDKYSLPDSLEGWEGYVRMLVGATIDIASLSFRKRSGSNRGAFPRLDLWLDLTLVSK